GNDPPQKKSTDAVLGEPGRLDRSQNHEQIQRQRDEHADEPLLLGEHREDEIVVGNRQKLVLALRALHEPLAGKTAGPYRDAGLALLVTLPLRIQLRVDERRDASLLVVLEREIPRDRREQH